MRMSLSEIVAAVEPSQVVGAIEPGLELYGARMDSRLIEPDDLFIAIKGERVDGHDFAAAAVKRGAAAVLAERPLELSAPVLVAPDVLAAMGRLAARHRLDAQASVVAVTGSAGKTTLKETLHRVLSTRFEVAKNYKNFNNQIGLPLSLLAASERADYWVMEAGISRPGDMDELAAMVQPDVAVIHNVGAAHLEGLGSVAGVAREKAKLLDWVRLGGAVVVSADYPELWAEAASRDFGKDVELIGFSRRKDAPSSVRFIGEYLGASGGSARYRLEFDGRAATLTLPLLGAHFLENLLAAAATAARCGLPTAELPGLFEEALAGGVCVGEDAPAGRFQCRSGGEHLLIDDTYNANPLSMSRAVDSAIEAAAGAPLVLVLGEMGELGPEADEAHRDLGLFIADRARAASIPAVFFQHVGQDGASRAAAFGDGLAKGGYRGLWAPVGSPEEFLAGWGELHIPAATLLFKGSRSARMEKYVTAFESTLSAARGEGETA